MSEVLKARVGDVERNACVDRLTAELVAGRLAEGEFDGRVERALRSQTQGDLAELTEDLTDPTAPPLPAQPQPAEPVISLTGGDVALAVLFSAVVGLLTFYVAMDVLADDNEVRNWLLLWLFGEVCGLAGALLARGGRR